MVTAGGAVTDGQKPVRRSSWPGKLGGYSLADLPGKKEGVQSGRVDHRIVWSSMHGEGEGSYWHIAQGRGPKVSGPTWLKLNQVAGMAIFSTRDFSWFVILAQLP